EGPFMNFSFSRWTLLPALILLPFSRALQAELLSLTGEASASVKQLSGAVEVQTDSNTQTVPLTQSQPPATARARLDRLLADGSITAGGRALTIFDQAGATPNDAGLDLGAFSNDSRTSWSVDGSVSEVRTLQLSHRHI